MTLGIFGGTFAKMLPVDLAECSVIVRDAAEELQADAARAIGGCGA